MNAVYVILYVYEMAGGKFRSGSETPGNSGSAPCGFPVL